MVLLTLVAIAMLSLSTIEQRSSGGGANEADRMARANARMALMNALGELKKAAGPVLDARRSQTRYDKDRFKKHLSIFIFCETNQWKVMVLQC